MEDILTPQICMDVDEIPLDIGKDDTSDDSSSESNEPEIGDDERVKLLLENQFSDSAQVPQELTDFEKEAKRNVFAIGEPAVQFQRLHCTACNVHLGSAPIGHFNRYIHPLLKVLLCKHCYEFYCSGEFDKDEDGSEMYCRWCGQGGKVMCCAQCAYVFCQKCVRQNLGRRTLELIKDSDDWLCFGCNPTQLINLKIICTSLFEFVQEEIRLSKSLNNIERLKVDHSVCCQKVKAAKRKRDDDVPYTPNKNDWEEFKPKKPSILKSSLSKPFTTEDNSKTKSWNQKEEAEVVCTPDLLTLMEDDAPPLTSISKPTELSNHSGFTPTTNRELNKASLNTKHQPTIPSKVIRHEGKRLYAIAPKSMMICGSTNLQRPPTNLVRFQSPTIKFVPSVNRFPAVVNSIPAQITPGTKHEWYDKAAAVVSTITGSLSTTLTNLTKEQKSAKSVEQLANIHNKLQELLSSSVNSLIQARKNLRAEFLDDLNKLKFSNVYSCRNNISVAKPDVKNVPRNEVVDHDDDDNDDDVIIINSETSSVKTFKEPPPLVKISSSEVKLNARPYLKVRSVSQLLTVSSECITIPDDPPQSSTEADAVAVQDKDPLAVVPETFDECTVTDNTKNSENVISKDYADLVDDQEIKMKNILAENKIQELVRENMKLKIIDVLEHELKRVLSVRVLLSTNFQENLPNNRLKSSESFVDASVTPTICEDENMIQESGEFTDIGLGVDTSLSVGRTEENSSVQNDCTDIETREVAESENEKNESNNEALHKKEEIPSMDIINELDNTGSLDENKSNNSVIINEEVNLAEKECLSVLKEINDSNKCDNSNLMVDFPLLHLSEKFSDHSNSGVQPADQTTSDDGREVENSQ